MACHTDRMVVDDHLTQGPWQRRTPERHATGV